MMPRERFRDMDHRKIIYGTDLLLAVEFNNKLVVQETTF